MNSQRSSEVIRDRSIRHNRLMKLIKNYTCSDEQVRKLQRIKINTMMQINIRYLRSDHNRYYKFPKKEMEESSDDELQIYDPVIDKKENIIYDLRSQNQIIKPKSQSQKVLSLDNSRKIASLDIQRNQVHREKILRLHTKSIKQLSTKQLSRKNSITDKYKKEGLRLPELKLDKGREYLKTQSKNEQQQELNSVIGKKLHTESSEQNYKLKGVERYLKKIEHIQKQHEIKNNYRKKVFLPDKGN